MITLEDLNWGGYTWLVGRSHAGLSQTKGNPRLVFLLKQ